MRSPRLRAANSSAPPTRPLPQFPPSALRAAALWLPLTLLVLAFVLQEATYGDPDGVELPVARHGNEGHCHDPWRHHIYVAVTHQPARNGSPATTALIRKGRERTATAIAAPYGGRTEASRERESDDRAGYILTLRADRRAPWAAVQEVFMALRAVRAPIATVEFRTTPLPGNAVASRSLSQAAPSPTRGEVR